MDNKDTFHTFGYRGGFIHTCYNRRLCVEEVSVQRYEGDKARPAKSVFAAKVAISKFLTKGGKS